MWLYYSLDVLVTLSEAFALYLVSAYLCKNPRFCSHMWKLVPPFAFFCVTMVTTWFTDLGVYKVLVIATVYIICMNICFRNAVYESIVCYEIILLPVSLLSENICFLCVKWVYGNDTLVEIDGMSILRWETYMFLLVIRVFMLIGIYALIKDWQYQFKGKDILVISLNFLAALGISLLPTYQYLNLGILSNDILEMTAIFLTVAFIAVFMYSKNTLYIREQEQKNHLTIERMNRQFSYYQEKAEDEKRVRALYHDMKNHLLILERQNSPETKQMAVKLRQQISDYEDYIHTGNDFLDIIIRDKAKKAKEQETDFSANINFEKGDFLAPLDVSTIFGNALDNALEASEKLPREQRMITVRADCVREMLSIVFENNCLESGGGYEHTDKQDKFLHGFGIQNIRSAVEKYDGQCLIKQEYGQFVVKIILPLPEG